MYAAKAIAFYEAMEPAFKKYVKKVIENTQHLANDLYDRGRNIVSE